MNVNAIERQISKVVRAKVNMTGKPYPINFTDGFAKPKVEGEPFHFTTRTGLPVYHPSAYSRKGWSSLVYHASTIQIVVGKGWACKNVLCKLPPAKDATTKAA